MKKSGHFIFTLDFGSPHQPFFDKNHQDTLP
jgi:hypothetical protein